MARTLEENGKECQAESEAKMVERKAPSGERTKIARDLLIDKEDKEFQDTNKNVRQKFETPCCSSYALPNYQEELWDWCIQQNLNKS